MPFNRFFTGAFIFCCPFFAVGSSVDLFDCSHYAGSCVAGSSGRQTADFLQPDLASAGTDWRLLPYLNRPAGTSPAAVAVGNISGSQRPDIVIATSYFFDPETDYHLLLFRPNNANSFFPFTKYPYLPITTNRPSIAVLDLDRRFGADIVVGGGQGITRFLSTAEGTLVSSTQQASDAAALAAVDLDGDKLKDIVAISLLQGGMLHRNLGNGFFQSTPWNTPERSSDTMGHGDLNNDGREDIVLGSREGTLFPYRNVGDGTLTPLPTLTSDCLGSFFEGVGGVGIGDINGDGFADIVASGGNSASSCVTIFRADGNGGFETPSYLLSYDIPKTIRISDMDGDGRDDIIVAHDSFGAIGVYLQQPNGSLASERLFPVSRWTSQAHSFEVADLDLDGCADIVLAGSGLVTLRGVGCNPIFASGFE